MKRLRHRLGRWLLRDDGSTAVLNVTTSASAPLRVYYNGKRLEGQTLTFKHENFGGSRGLS